MKKRKPRINKIEIYAIAAILIIAILGFSYYRYTQTDYNYLKQDKSEHIIYTLYDNESSTYRIQVPYINIKHDQINEANTNIQQLGNKYKNLKKSVFKYEYTLNGSVLSLLIKASSYNNAIPEIEFLSYNINLLTGEILTDDVLLSYYSLNNQSVSKKIENQLKKYYNDVLKQGYMSQQECDYKCFLNVRNIKNYLDNVEYFIEDGILYAYKPFLTTSIYGEENYFTEDHFKFEIATIPTIE